MAECLRIAIVDDHPVVRAGLRVMLSQDDAFDVVVECGTGTEAVDALQTTHVDVVVLDLNLPDLRGETVVVTLLKRSPTLPIVVLTMEQDDNRMLSALRAGARAYMLKGADPDELVQAIRAVARGELVIGSGASDLVASYLRTGETAAETAFPSLTSREREVLALLAQNASNDEIARRLAIRSKTVRNVVSTVLVKIHARDRADAILRARSAGIGTRER